MLFLVVSAIEAKYFLKELEYCQTYLELLQIEAGDQKWWQLNYLILCLDQCLKIYCTYSIRMASYPGWL